MAEIATIARPYAEALFKASGSSLADTHAWLNALATVASHASVQQLAASPKVTNEQVLDLVLSVAGVQTQAGINFLRVVIENGRLSALPEIATQYQALKNGAEGVSDAVVYSAFPIEASVLADLMVGLEKRFAKKLNAQIAIDPTLIGGVRVVVGDEVLDTSVRARLDQMKASLVAA